MTKKFLFILLLIFCIIPGESLLARELYRMGRSNRSIAMGFTGVSSANDGSALFYNPAVLANIHTWWVTVPVITAEYSDDAQELIKDARGDGFKLDTIEEKRDFLEKYNGKNPYARLAVGADFMLNLDSEGFTLGLNYLQEVIVDIETRNPVSPEISFYGRWDTISQGGFSLPLFKGMLVMGVGYRNLQRKVLDFDYTLADALADKEFPQFPNDAETGSGSGYDVGFLFRIPGSAHASLGIVGQNIGGIDLGEAGKETQEYSAGFSIAPEFGIFRLTLAVDARDLTFERNKVRKSTRPEGSDGSDTEDEKKINRRLHYGAELGIFTYSREASVVSLRGGYSQGYPSYGAEINLFRAIKIGYTQYSEEVGEFAGQKESKRKMAYLSFGF